MKKHELSNIRSKIAKAKGTLTKIDRKVEKRKSDLAKENEKFEAYCHGLEAKLYDIKTQMVRELANIGRNAFDLLLVEFQEKLAEECTQGSKGGVTIKEQEDAYQDDENIIDKEEAWNQQIQDELSLSDHHSYPKIPLSSPVKSNPKPVKREDCERKEP